MAFADRYHYSPEYLKDSLYALETALGTAPLYRDWRPYDPGPAAPLRARYAALPELTKSAMREHFPDGLIPNHLRVEDGLKRDEIEYTFTSGTTGEKVINVWNQAWWYAAEAASWKLNANTARLTHPQKDAKLASSLNVGIHCEEDLPTDLRILGRTLYLIEKIIVICWQRRHMERMARELETYRPVVLEANPSLLARLAFWALDNGRELYSPAVIIFTYEFPSRIHLDSIRRVFSSPLASSYGSTETGFVMMQCEKGLFHQNTEFCRIDFEPLAPRHGGPELGRILVTTFRNPWASVVKFDMGDLIRLHPSGECACSRSSGLIAEAVEGRVANATFTTGGDLVSTMALDSRLALIPEIRDYHLEQNDRKTYELQLVLGNSSKRIPERVILTLKDLYGSDGTFQVVSVPDLLPGPAGKYRRTQVNFEFDERGLFE
jgi:phenylacetate-coenzyme A ligase PaaK-like adenylate-forming protein